MFSKSRPESDFEATQCPVCRALFGQRDKTAIFKAHCDECRATYWWKPWADRPSAVLDRDAARPKGFCGPQGCICR